MTETPINWEHINEAAAASLDAFHRALVQAGACRCETPEVADEAVGDLLYSAWCVIANAMNVGDPPVDPVPGWHTAAERWRDRYHAWLGTNMGLPADPTLPEGNPAREPETVTGCACTDGNQPAAANEQDLRDAILRRPGYSHGAA